MAATGSWSRNGAIGIIVPMLLFGCRSGSYQGPEVELRPCPDFNADSAFSYIETQVDFGPRVPSTAAHDTCGDFLVAKLIDFGASVTEQVDTVNSYQGRKLPLRNIIGSFNPTAEKRILLAAHWDTRPFADQDTERKDEPILGANDGASGVAVLLEMARCIQQQSPSVGVDIVFFDLEDQGIPAYESAVTGDEYYFCLGSRYWSEHLNGYSASFGILLDMVGAKNARFTLEATSMERASEQMRHVWDIGNQLGYEERFVYNLTPGVIDDHYYINRSTEIPTLNIIHNDNTRTSTFWPAWHTHADDVSQIDRSTLKAVGQTVVQVVYNQQ